MANLRVTVCELDCESSALEEGWSRLVAHARERSSELVLLPEMAFAPWFPAVRNYDAATWQRAVDAHDRWLARLVELAPATVLGTRPVNREKARFNEAFVWQRDQGYRAAHLKSFLPDEEEFWEASWYDGGHRPRRSRAGQANVPAVRDLAFKRERARIVARCARRSCSGETKGAEREVVHWTEVVLQNSPSRLGRA